MAGINLSKSTISLEKNSTINLIKEDSSLLKNAMVGLGWDPVKKKGIGRLFGGGSIDLDASIITYDASLGKNEIISYSNLSSSNNAIRHQGDNLTGDGEGDDERILINLENVNPADEYLAVVINSFSRQKFSEVENVHCRIVDSSTNQELVRYNMVEQGGDNTAILIGVFHRLPSGGWDFKATAVPFNGQTAKHIVSDVAQHLR